MGQAGKDLNKILNGQGYRLTKSRQKILDVLFKASKHLSVDDIYLAIKAKGGSVGITTIYRAVDSLTKAGIIRRISLSNDRASYELIKETACEHHHHLICRKCQRVMEYSNFLDEEVKLMKRLEKIVSKAQHFKVEDHQLSFTGLCKLCK